jgi:hypothetical protein
MAQPDAVGSVLAAAAANPARAQRIAQLRVELARRRAVNWRYGLKKAAILGALFGVLGLAELARPLWSLLGPPGDAAVIVVAIGVLIAGWAVAARLQLPEPVGELALDLELMVAERGEIAAAERLVASGTRFALFLRSFDVERKAAAEVDEKARTIAEVEYRAQMESGGIAHVSWEHLPDDLKVDPDTWVVQGRVLGALAGRLPVVQLGNKRFRSHVPMSAPSDRVIQIMMVTGDWWEVFRWLAANAEVVVIYLEQRTRSLEREMQHLVGSAIRTIVVTREAAGGVTASRDRPGLLYVGCPDPQGFDGTHVAQALDSLGIQ